MKPVRMSCGTSTCGVMRSDMAAITLSAVDNDNASVRGLFESPYKILACVRSVTRAVSLKNNTANRRGKEGLDCARCDAGKETKDANIRLRKSMPW